ncbi:hypothetical protein MHYP_G00001910 [Metynnis hypsauchen]
MPSHKSSAFCIYREDAFYPIKAHLSEKLGHRQKRLSSESGAAARGANRTNTVMRRFSITRLIEHCTDYRQEEERGGGGEKEEEEEEEEEEKRKKKKEEKRKRSSCPTVSSVAPCIISSEGPSTTMSNSSTPSAAAQPHRTSRNTCAVHAGTAGQPPSPKSWQTACTD